MAQPERNVEAAPKKKRGRPSKVDKLRQRLTDNFSAYENATMPRYMSERLKSLDLQNHPATYALWREWQC